MVRLGKNNVDLMSKKERMLKWKKSILATAHIYKTCRIQGHDVPDFPESLSRVVLSKSMSTAKKALVWFLLLLTSTVTQIFVCWGYRAVNMCSSGRLIWVFHGRCQYLGHKAADGQYNGNFIINIELFSL